jgi:hypothetical protein
VQRALPVTLFQYIPERQFFRDHLLKLVVELNTSAHYDEMKNTFDTNMRYLVSLLVNSRVKFENVVLQESLDRTSRLDVLRQKLTIHDINS